MGYPKDGRKGYAAMCYINTIPHGQVDHRAVPRGEDPPPASSWQRYLAATGEVETQTLQAARSPSCHGVRPWPDRVGQGRTWR